MTDTTTRPPRFDVLFEPVQIGPVTARNRFFQVPHCNGMGYRDVSAHAEMRRIKAEGGWAVVCTEQAEIHYSSEITPFIELRVWDDQDIPALARIADSIHEHGALAGIELTYNGMNGPNFYSRVAPMGPAHLPVATFTADPVQARRMDLTDIARPAALAPSRGAPVAAGRATTSSTSTRAMRSAASTTSSPAATTTAPTRTAARRRTACGCCASSSRTRRRRSPAARRWRAASPSTSCSATRASRATTSRTSSGRWASCPTCGTSSWAPGRTTPSPRGSATRPSRSSTSAGLKALTSKPVVGVGRFTSADTMVRMVTSGVLDLIGAARPSIADPFLPRKIEEGRFDDIRECIGCNICVAGDFTMSPIRCTQNPTMGEEWRRGWHPERIRPRSREAKVLIVGGGPAGLEAAQALGKRGYEVILAEEAPALGGRVAREARLPGMASYIRVRRLPRGPARRGCERSSARRAG